MLKYWKYTMLITNDDYELFVCPWINNTLMRLLTI